MNPVATRIIGDFVVEVHYDQHPESPRSRNMNLGVLVGFHNQFLGDPHRYANYNQWVEDILEPEEPAEDPYYLHERVFAYIHGGISISTAPFYDPWDSGMVGVIYTTRQRVKNLGFDPEDPETVVKVREALKDEVVELNDYLSSEHYAVWVYDRCGRCNGPEGKPTVYVGYTDVEEALKTVSAEMLGVSPTPAGV